MAKLMFTVLIGLLLVTTSQAQNVALEWAKSIGGKGSQTSRSVITDANGNVYITGNFSDTVDFDPGPNSFTMVAKGKADIFVTKLDARGGFVWAIQMGSNATSVLSVEMGSSIALDSFGHILLAGNFADTADFDPGTGVYNLISNGGQSDAFVLQLDTAGNFLWAVSWGNDGPESASSIITDILGNVFITGEFAGTVDFDPGSGVFNLVNPQYAIDAFVLKLDSNGTFVWVKQLYAPEWGGRSRDLATDDLGNIYVSGDMNISAQLGWGWDGVGSIIFVWKLDATGNTKWVYQLDKPLLVPNSQARSIKWSSAGYLYVTGCLMDLNSTGLAVDFDPGPGQALYGSAGHYDIFVLKLDTAGKYVHAKTIGSTAQDEARYLALDAFGNTYIAGSFNQTVDFDPKGATANLTSAGGSDIFILKLDTALNYVWAKSMGSIKGDVGFGITVDYHGAIYTTGQFNDMADFDPGSGITNLTSKGGTDVFIQKLICNDTTVTVLTQEACDSFVLNGVTYTRSGSYTQRRPNIAGCDSIITLDLTIPVLEPLIAVNVFVLATTQPYNTYQWYLNGILIPGAIDSNYTVMENGLYTVSVTNERGCTGTSPDYNITNVTNISKIGLLDQQVQIYPNPADTKVNIESKGGAQMQEISMVDVLGVVRCRYAITNPTQTTIKVEQLPPGIYLLRVQTDKGTLIRKQEILR